MDAIAERIAAAQSIPDKAAAALTPLGGLLRCNRCGREQSLGDAAGHIRNGWPQCHGLTMMLYTERQLAAERLDAGRES